MNVIFWIILAAVLIAIFGGAILAGAIWVAWYALVGLVIGGVGRLLVPHSGGFGAFGTILAGIAGAMIGGIIANAAELSGFLEFLVAVLAAAVVVAISSAASGGSERELT